MTRFDNPPNQPPVGGEAWSSYPQQRDDADDAWRDGLAKPELEFVEALDELGEAWREASVETDRDFARALARWPEPAWWHKVAGGSLVATGIAGAVVGVAALTAQADPVPVSTDSVASLLLAVLIPLGAGASSLLRTRRDGIGRTGLHWRSFLLGAALVLPIATIGMLRETWATPALWAFVPLAAVLGVAAVTGWRFSRPSER